MSATTENLLEEIKRVEEEMTQCQVNGDSHRASQLTEVMKKLQRRLAIANDALTEGRQLLKS